MVTALPPAAAPLPGVIAVAAASVIVRARDAEATIERALRALRDQTVPVEIVVVDSGSTDATLEIARRYGDSLIEIAPEQFTYGRALNVGARAAGEPINFALSAHCAPQRVDWIERSLAHYERPEVAGTTGYRPPGPRGQSGVVLQDLAALRYDPFWGYSNTAGSWRAEVWERFPFAEGLPAAEDREWSWRVLEAGWAIAMDPALEVPSEHRTRPGPLHVYGRERKESQVIASMAGPSAYPAGRALRDWWRPAPSPGRSPARIRISPWHIASIAGRYTGVRQARNRRHCAISSL